jgi:hypothetical protein
MLKGRGNMDDLHDLMGLLTLMGWIDQSQMTVENIRQAETLCREAIVAFTETLEKMNALERLK